MIENEAVGMKRVEHQTVGLEKENMNMKSRADLLREKKESYNEDLALCKKQMDEMVEKEEYLVIEMKDLEEEVPSWRLRWLLWRMQARHSNFPIRGIGYRPKHGEAAAYRYRIKGSISSECFFA